MSSDDALHSTILLLRPGVDIQDESKSDRLHEKSFLKKLISNVSNDTQLPTFYDSFDEYTSHWSKLYLTELIAQLYSDWQSGCPDLVDSKMENRSVTDKGSNGHDVIGYSMEEGILNVYCRHGSFTSFMPGDLIVFGKGSEDNISLKNIDYINKSIFGVILNVSDRGDQVVDKLSQDESENEFLTSIKSSKLHLKIKIWSQKINYFKLPFYDEMIEDYRTLLNQVIPTNEHVSSSPIYATCNNDYKVFKYATMSTANREFGALYTVPKLPTNSWRLLSGGTVKSRPEKVNNIFSLTDRHESLLLKQFNSAQFVAVSACLDSVEVNPDSLIYLIHGPPGTGKTTTIIGIVAAWLFCQVSVGHQRTKSEINNAEETKKKKKTSISKKKKNIDSDSDFDSVIPYGQPFKRPRKKDTISPFTYLNFDETNLFKNQESFKHSSIENRGTYLSLEPPTSLSTPPMNPKALCFNEKTLLPFRLRTTPILIAAPSNTAIDEICSRLITKGLFNPVTNHQYFPKVIRVGPNSSNPIVSETIALDKVLRRTGSKVPHMSIEELKENLFYMEVDVICSTLSVVGSRDMTDFCSKYIQYVIVDEASNCVELSTLITLSTLHKLRKLILVGDPQQLPATVFSQTAISKGYATSFFSRLQEIGKVHTYLLSEQFRMHEEISNFTNAHFYNSKVLNSKSKKDFDYAPFSTLIKKTKLKKRLNWLNLTESKCVSKFNSFVNYGEIDVVELLLKSLLAIFKNSETLPSICVISPYGAQVGALNKRLKYLSEFASVATIDSFQGKEADIIICSTVKSVPPCQKGSVGFLRDIRRLNVLCTRARHFLFIVGNGGTLVRNADWAALFNYCAKDLKSVFNLTRPVSSFMSQLFMEKDPSIITTTADSIDDNGSGEEEVVEDDNEVHMYED